MRTEEIRELTADEIRRRIQEEENQLQQFRFQHAVSTLVDPSQLRNKRRLIARLKTLLGEKERITQ
ncbi:MAG TPA: 50S ribosomal protein L29 [Rhodothermales bacterium]|nr:50S ribosomal protein L29 [Rhodothermales bacterium]